MFPDVQVAEKSNGNGQSVQGRAEGAPWETVPGFGDIMIVSLAQVADEIPGWSIYPARRDTELRKLVRNSDGALGSAVNTMQSKGQSLPFKVNAPGAPRTQKRFSDMLGTCEFGEGFSSLFGKTLVDFYTQDNGWFIELIGAGRVDKKMVGPVQRMAHLDSALCWRTFSKEGWSDDEKDAYPVIYTNPYTGEYQKIHKSRIVYGSSFAQSDELARGIGFCAVSRAFLGAQIARDVMIYKHEKISGRFTRALGWTTGFTEKSFEGALEQAAEKNDARGFTRYALIPFMHSMKDGASINKLDLASLPDGFDFQTDMTLWIYLLAFAFGVDAREFWPATASGATKADATVQHQKAQYKGFAENVKSIEHTINWKVFPEGVELEFDAKDDEEDQRVASFHQTQIINEDLLVKNGTITPAEGRAILISQGVIDPDVLQTATEPIVADDSAPVDLETRGQPVPLPEQKPVPPVVTPPVAPPIGTKEDTPAEKPPEPEKPVIKGKPLPDKEATKVEPFTEGEIADLFDTYTKLKGKVKPDA